MSTIEVTKSEQLQNDVAEILRKVRELAAKYDDDQLQASAISIQLELETFLYNKSKSL
jgi:hypothetical protein